MISAVQNETEILLKKKNLPLQIILIISTNSTGLGIPKQCKARYLHIEVIMSRVVGM